MQKVLLIACLGFLAAAPLARADLDDEDAAIRAGRERRPVIDVVNVKSPDAADNDRSIGDRDDVDAAIRAKRERRPVIDVTE